MKKVFSVRKFIEWCKMMKLSNEEIDISCKLWANKCDGLTENEMNILGYRCPDYWMIEVEVIK